MTDKPSLGQATRLWGQIGVLSFGGPAAQIALMHREVVERRGWLSEQGFLNALSFCMLLPGPEAMQLATYVGWRIHGTVGGIIAGLLFVLPGALVILALAGLYAVFGDLPLMQALFLGVKAAVLVIVLEALLKVAGRALKGAAHWWLAGLAFVALFVFNAPYPLVVFAAGLWGFFSSSEVAEEAPPSTPVPIAQTLRSIVIWLAIWWVPILALELALPGHVLGEIGRFFSLLATVTFGGAYAVLAYMAQAAVEGYGWLAGAEMADALGLAETTPGPLILVTEFVAFLGAARDSGDLSLWMGALGAIVALWATFAPCFLWVLTGAPYIERLQHMPRLKSALAAITAAVVGVILNLSVWFALTVTFGEVARAGLGPFRPWVPELASFDWRVPVLALVAGVFLLRLKRSVVLTLGVSAALGVLLSAV